MSRVVVHPAVATPVPCLLLLLRLMRLLLRLLLVVRQAALRPPLRPPLLPLLLCVLSSYRVAVAARVRMRVCRFVGVRLKAVPNHRADAERGQLLRELCVFEAVFAVIDDCKHGQGGRRRRNCRKTRGAAARR